MVALKPNLASYSRVSYYRELHGDLDGALEAMRLAVSAGGGAAENVAYVQTLLGNLDFQRGEIGAAGARLPDRARARARRTCPRPPGSRPSRPPAATWTRAITRYRGVVETSAVHEYHLLLLEALIADGRLAAAEREIAEIRANQAIERRTA